MNIENLDLARRSTKRTHGRSAPPHPRSEPRASADSTSTRQRPRPPAQYQPHLVWREGTAKLLPLLLAGRYSGPVFLTDRRAPANTPAADRCPVTGRARLSYRRAAELFQAATEPLDPAGRGWALRSLRLAGKLENRP